MVNSLLLSMYPKVKESGEMHADSWLQLHLTVFSSVFLQALAASRKIAANRVIVSAQGFLWEFFTIVICG
jgi:hypothetical protein